MTLHHLSVPSYIKLNRHPTLRVSILNDINDEKPLRHRQTDVVGKVTDYQRVENLDDYGEICYFQIETQLVPTDFDNIQSVYELHS